jgi:predicted P-loop ATPase
MEMPPPPPPPGDEYAPPGLNDPPPPDDSDAPPNLSVIQGGGNRTRSYHVVPGLTKSLASACRILRDPALRELTLGPGEIELNELTERVEFNRKPLLRADVVRWRETVELKIRGTDGRKSKLIQLPNETSHEAFDVLASENPYHPVREYLSGLTWVQELPSAIDIVARKAFHQTDPLALKLLRWFFIGAVARAMKPGSKHDHFLVLIGNEDVNKSRSIKALCDPWVSDTELDLNDPKRALSMLNRFWVHEIAELKSFRSKRGHEIKQFLGSPTDNFIPFGGGRDGGEVSRPRSCVFVGTTNERQFLTDATGNRRTHPIHINKEIDLEIIAQFRDQLWAEAVAAWESGEKFFPDETMDKDALKLEAAKLMESDPWSEKIEAWLIKEPTLVTTNAGLSTIGVPDDKQSKRDEMRIADILRHLGWVKLPQTMIDGVRHYPWEPGEGWSRRLAREKNN